MSFQSVNPLKSYKVGADVKVKVIGYRVLDANKLVSSSSSSRICIAPITKKNIGATIKKKHYNKKITIKPNNWAKRNKLA